jgi:hypothetical protein
MSKGNFSYYCSGAAGHPKRRKGQVGSQEAVLITLQEYSKKYGISVSQVRHRIEKGHIRYQRGRGRRYFVEDKPTEYDLNKQANKID